MAPLRLHAWTLLTKVGTNLWPDQTTWCRYPAACALFSSPEKKLQQMIFWGVHRQQSLSPVQSTDSSPYHLYCLDIPKNWNEETTREESISILDQKTGFKKSRLHVVLCLRQVYLGCAQGLDVQTAKVRLEEFGPNVLSHKSRATWWWILWNAFFHPFNMILLVLAAISGATSDMSTLSIMVAMVVLSVGLRFWQVCFL